MNKTLIEKVSHNRRAFLSRMSLALGGLAAAAASVPVLAALINPWLRKEPKRWRPVGSLTQFQEGGFTLVNFTNADPEPWAGVAHQTAAWLRRDSATQFTAFSIHCTHLGCPVRWVASAELFMCPCHGGVFYKDGTVAAGPPPKGLVQYPVRVRNGQVEIQTTEIPVTTTVRV